MFARSILWSVKEIDHCIQTLCDEPMLRGRELTITQSNKARMTIRELVELVGNAPSQPSNPTRRCDSELTALLDVMYADRDAGRDVVRERLPDGTAVIETLQSAGQIETRHGEVFVPLQGHRAAHNWLPVLRLLVDWVGSLLGAARELVHKLRADGADDTSTELLLVQSLLRRIENLWRVCRLNLGHLQVLNYTVFVDAQLDRFVTEVFPDALTTDTTTVEGIL